MNTASIQRNMFTSFLDLICCGLGAAILLFLLVVAFPSDAANVESKCILVFGKVVDGPKAEIAIEFKRPSDTSWNRVGADVVNFSSSTTAKVGGSAVCAIQDIEPGVYQFQIVMVNFPRSRADQKCMVQMEVSGHGIEKGKSVPSELPRPGKSTAALKVNVEASPSD